MPEIKPAFRSPENNEGTLLATPWSDGQPAVGAQNSPPPRPMPPSAASSGWSGGQPGSTQPAGAAAPWSGGQAGPVQAPQAGSWMPQGAGNQPQPVSMNRSAVELPPPTRRRKKGAGRIWARLLLVLILLVAVLAGAWFLGVRPYLHNLAQTQLDQALNAPESQILLAMIALPPGAQQVIHGSESSMNIYLSAHDSDQIQNLHMTITPTAMNLSFTVYGQNCSISALPIVTNGEIQVTQVQVQGVLNLIMSNDELTSSLNSNLQSFSAQMTHKVSKITLLEHEIDIQLS